MTADIISLLTWENLTGKAVDLAPQVAASLVIFLLFWLGANVVRRVLIRVGRTRGIDASLARLFARAAKIGLIVFGAITALGTLGIDVAALVAGLGLTGFALGFALKDVVSNVLAGMLLIIYKPFQQGDRIEVAKFSGTVTSIDLRYTMLDSEGKKIFVPNSLLFTNAITVEPN